MSLVHFKNVTNRLFTFFKKKALNNPHLIDMP